MRTPKARLALLDLVLWYLDRMKERGVPHKSYQPIMGEVVLKLSTFKSAAGKRQYVNKTLGGFIEQWDKDNE